MRTIFFLTSALALVGCSTIAPKPVIERRYTSAVFGEPAEPLDLAVATAPSEPESKGVKITALGDRAQAALIEATKGSPPLVIKSKGGGAGVVELRNATSRVLVVSAKFEDFQRPGDRVDAMQYSLTVNQTKSPGWRITGWSAAASDTKAIKVGSLTDESSSKVTASTGLGLGPLLPSAQVGYEGGHTATRVAEINDPSYLDAAVTPDGTAWMLQTGGWRDNLAHNSSIEVQLEIDPSKLIESNYVTFSKLFEDDGANEGKPLPAKSVRMAKTKVFVPTTADRPICGLANAKFRVRHIVGGDKTFSESDDQVEYQNGEAHTPFLIAPPPGNGLFVIYVGPNLLVYRETPNSPVDTLRFGSLDDAVSFLAWLQATGFTGGKSKSGWSIGQMDDFSFSPLTKTQLQDLAVGRERDSKPSLDLDYCLK